MKYQTIPALALATAFLAACGGGAGSSSPAANDGKVNSGAPAVNITAIVANAAPVANAGAAKNVVSGQVVFLDGSASTDANGDALTYAWTLTSKPSGSPATLLNTTSVAPSFIAIGAGTYVAALVVNDGKIDSIAATVTFIASTANAAPVANAGVGQSVGTGSTVTLSGAGSTNANGDILTYSWSLTSKPTGSAAALSGANLATPTFVADLAGVYVATLFVNDGKASSAAATVSIDAGTAPLPVGAGTFAGTAAKSFYRLDEASGVITIQPSNCPTFIAADTAPDGRVLAIYNHYSLASLTVDESRVAEIDILTGVCKDLFALPLLGMRGISIAPDGTIVTVGNNRVHRFTRAGVELGRAFLSGSSTMVGVDSLAYADAIDFAPDGKLYATRLTSVWQLDPLTGIGTLKALGVAGLGDIDIDSAGVLRAIYNSDLQLYSTATWSLIRSQTLDRGITSFFVGPLVHR